MSGKLIESLDSLVFTKKKKRVNILSYLFNKNMPLKLKLISNQIGEPPGYVYSDIFILKDAGLIETNKGKKGLALVITLTDKGKLVGKYLKDIAKLIKEIENGN